MKTDPGFTPYIVVPSTRSPSGADVVCRHHLVSEDINPREAFALANALNEEYLRRMAQ